MLPESPSRPIYLWPGRRHNYLRPFPERVFSFPQILLQNLRPALRAMQTERPATTNRNNEASIALSPARGAVLCIAQR